MRSKLIGLLVALLALSLGLPLCAYADTSQANVTVTVGPVFYLTLDTDWVMDWTGITVADYKKATEVLDHPIGWTITSKNKAARLWTNSDWQLTIQGNGGDYFAVDPIAYPGVWEEKPVGDIAWRNGVETGWHHLTTSPYQVETGPPGTYDSNPSDFSIPFIFRILLSWAHDSPGVYEYNSVLFVLCAP